MTKSSILAILFSLLFIEPSQSSTAFTRRALKLPHFGAKNHQLGQSLLQSERCLSMTTTGITLRGGSNICEAVQDVLPSIPLTNIFAYTAALTGAAVAIDPGFMFQQFGMEDLEKDSLAEMLARAMGYFQAGAGLTFILVEKCPVTRAIGLGLLPRVIFLLTSVLSGDMSKFEDIKNVKEKMIAKLIFASGVTISFLSGKVYPETLPKIIAAIHFLVGVPLSFTPTLVFKTFTGLDLDDEKHEKTKVMAEHLGYQTLGYGTYVGALSIGCEPMKALAYTTTTYALCTAKCMTGKSKKVLGVRTRDILAKAIILAGFAVGFFMQTNEKVEEAL